MGNEMCLRRITLPHETLLHENSVPKGKQLPANGRFDFLAIRGYFHFALSLRSIIRKRLWCWAHVLIPWVQQVLRFFEG